MSDQSAGELSRYLVVIRGWGPEHEPGEAEVDDYVVEADDINTAEDLAIEEAIDGGVLRGRRSGEVISKEAVPA